MNDKQRPGYLLFAFLLCLIIAGCSSSGSKRGGYYKDDGPGSDPPANIQAIPDAAPRIEPHHRATKRPYVVFGKRYIPMSSDQPFRQEGIASWYGRKFHGNKTANGETYDMYAMTAAHPTLPIPSYARVTRVANGRSVIVRINDRGPFHSGRIIDLSYVAASKLGLIGPGSGRVIVEAITHDDIRAGRFGGPTTYAQAQNSAGSMPSEPSTHSISSAATPQPVIPAEPISERIVPDALIAMQLQAEMADSNENQPDTESNTVNPAPESSNVPPVTPSGFYLQFGAFSNAENAQALAEKINAELASIDYKNAQVSPGNTLYRVQLGPYSNRTEAVNAALRFEEILGAQPTIALR
ncbi:MAG: septal ring lytic transglycosylase RlpA family lipoprotein [Pusillimonas sp.]|jgi:rare lipoprotein A|nr:septal ring lytic transglycosylase RlpA family lipoprotein [Pusillimonas sp.]|tara:strand:- start:1165 stop:2223 length:1059 start_codon:yes stop_codon:yes gene_type:complete